jgi:HSP20 family protein
MTLLGTTDFQTLVDRMFDELPFFPEGTASRLTGVTSGPAMDLYEKDGRYVVELAVPGYDAKEIHAEVNAGTLTISGVHADTSEKKTAKFYRKEMHRGSFTRTVTLPQDIDADSVEAKVEKGVLTLTLAPLKPIAAKKIAIKTTN